MLIDTGTFRRDPEVLVVDDDAEQARHTGGSLRRLGCRVARAGDGVEAVGIASTHPFDVILMECALPRLDGFSATERIRDQEAGRGRRPTPIVALSDHGCGDPGRLLEAGFDGLIGKPVRNRDLRGILTRWIEENDPRRLDPDSAGEETLHELDTIRRQLDRIAKTGGDDLLECYLDRYPALVRTCVAELRAGADGPRPRAERALHRLKSLAANLGLDQLWWSCVRCEELLYADPEGILPDLVDGIDRLVERCGDRLTMAARSLEEG